MDFLLSKYGLIFNEFDSIDRFAIHLLDSKDAQKSL